MRFKEFLKRNGTDNKYFIIVYTDFGTSICVYEDCSKLYEGKTYLLGKGDIVRYHAGNSNTKTQDHLHFYHNGSQLFAINRDGTAHDRSHGYKISKRHADIIANDFDFTLPDSNIIESCPCAVETTLLLSEGSL